MIDAPAVTHVSDVLADYLEYEPDPPRTPTEIAAVALEAYDEWMKQARRRTPAKDYTHVAHPGLDGYLYHDCRCAKCVAVHDETVLMARGLTEGMSPAEVGERFGVTRQTIHLRVDALMPGYRKELREIRRSHRAVCEAEERRGRTHPCYVCASPTVNAVTCGGACSARNILLRYHTDEARREDQVRRSAQWAVSNPDAVNDVQLRYAQRVLAGTDVEVHGRWLIEGSKTFEAAMFAYQSGGAAFDDLPEQIRGQIEVAA